MENHRIPPLTWPYYYHAKGVEELRRSLLCTTFELETTRLAAQEEIRRRDEEVKQLKDLLNRAFRDRDEANDKYQRLLLQIQQQQQQQQQQQLNEAQGLSSSECEESIVSGSSPAPSIGVLDVEVGTAAAAAASGTAPLPEKGKLLQAVMKAGPLLQTLLLAGPLPQWRHPPPPIDSLEIPPVTIPATTTFLQHEMCNSNITPGARKRDVSMCQESDDSSSPLKYRRVILH
eukprot:TRINITY_DN36807_c0_g1_i2.p1 TRINITY_DN36807_c0_g1~~TRINITY_DN36807_c0_g1_i2.p1  ORF type:complete len:231 (-),score=62.01 TRINITY_DN36807_c0_g1_i2:245-937(-)